VSAGRVLRLVGAPVEARPSRLFCGHCGEEPGPGRRPAGDSRVCEHCGLGLLLEASPEAAPHPRDPFLVADAGQTVCAVSRHAEELLGVSEPDAVNRPLSDLVVPADLANPAAYSLSAAVVAAATAASEPIQIAVRPTETFGVRFWARIASCGPPTAALLVIAAAD